MKKLALAIVAWMTFLSAVCGFPSEELDRLRDILTKCRGREGPTKLDELHAFAGFRGFSDAEMAARLTELVQEGLDGKADGEQVHVAKSALQALGFFGREGETAFARKVMREAADGHLRQLAVLAGLRMTPDRWEEWVREAAADKRFNDLERWIIYEDILRIGREGDEKTRQRVIEVLSEMRGKDAYPANRDSLGKWIAELKGGDAWEAWVKEVFAGEGFNDAAKRDACELAVQAGRNGDERTRQRVIEVFGELCRDESLDVDRTALRRWIGELEDLP